MRGLARFNGLRFVSNELPGSGRSKMITSVLAISRNEVWAARANDGVFRWNGQSWLHYEPGKNFPGSDVRRLRAFDSPQGRRLFVTTDAGVVAEFKSGQWISKKSSARNQ
jgi:ligand-binding sensor domain-containing protein